MFTKGQIIKWAEGGKRKKLKVIDIGLDEEYNHKITVKPVYFPSPKSTLRNKNAFSKQKIEISK